MGGATPGQAPGPVTGERVLASVKFYEDPKRWITRDVNLIGDH